MTTTPQPTARRRRFRFGLRTLLIVVTVAAVGSCAYWVAWPWWLDYRQRVRVEGAIQQLKIGSTLNEASAMLAIDFSGTWTNFSDFDFDCGFIRCHSLNYEYFVYFVFQSRVPFGSISTHPWQSVEAFRCARMPPDYTPRTQRGRDEMRAERNVHTQAQLHRDGFDYDFLDFATGGQRDSEQYELIYSDPPAKPEGK
jgi:hypothetical protein